MTGRNELHCIVIGGGIAGLAAAYSFAQSAAERRVALRFALLEAEARLGGLIQTVRRDSLVIETGPDAFITDKPEALELAQRLELEDQLLPTHHAHRRSFIVRDGKLRPLPAGFHLLAPSRLWPFIASEIIGWTGKARMLCDLVRPRGNVRADESLASFVRRRFGEQALHRIAQPMVAGIYGADPERLSLRATVPRFLELEERHRSVILGLRRAHRHEQDARGARYGLFLSFKSGMSTLVERLAARLPQGALRLRARVRAVARQGDEWIVETEQERLRAHTLCLALPAHAAARLLAPVDRSLADELASIEYASTAVINLIFRRADVPHPLDGFGFVVPQVERRALFACTWSSAKFPGRAPADRALLRAFVGNALQPEPLALDDAALLAAVRDDLRALMGIEHPPLDAHVQRWTDSMPQYAVGHLARLARIEEALAAHPSLALAGNAYRGVGIPDSIRSGQQAAEKLFRYLERCAPVTK
ncbi:MAG: protoporphyrinogen oxidase [Pyrinomonas sp.]|mgnify:CR=1 FL=1|uniref:protoporphyrinogen oxidase n=1 Tax=Pyrinomonas sp. TaxID=2080306 RepID=UPI00332EDB03